MKTCLCLAALFLVITGLVAGCRAASAGQSGEPKITITKPYALPALAEGNGVIYLDVVNEGGSADKLLKAASDVAEAVEMHETKIDENDVMQMTPLLDLEVPPGATVKLEPAGKHIMLVKLKQALNPGDTITLALTFEKTGLITVAAKVREIGAASEHNMEHNN